MNRFKIDAGYDSYYPFDLFVRGRYLGGWRWRRIGYFKTKEEALELYEKIKDLPEYLQ
jgi:hypothetical protein